MNNKKPISKEAAKGLKLDIEAKGMKSDLDIYGINEIIDSYIELKKELRWDISNKKLRWDGRTMALSTKVHRIQDVVIEAIKPEDDAFPYCIETEKGYIHWVAESFLSEIPIEEPKPFEGGDFVIDQAGRLCRLGEYYDHPKGKYFLNTVDMKTGRYLETYLNQIRRHATESDWEVEKDGVLWKAYVNLGGWIRIQHRPESWCDTVWYDVPTMIGKVNKAAANLSMRQLCNAMRIPIKSDSSAKM